MSPSEREANLPPRVRPLHLGLLTPSYDGVNARGSGIGVHFRHLAEGLREAGHRVTAVVAVEAGEAVEPARDFVVVVRAPRPRLLGSVGALHWQANQWLRERAVGRAAAGAAQLVAGVDAWETTSTGAPAGEFLRVVGRPPVAARVSTTASQLRTTNRGRRTAIGWLHERRERHVVRRSDALITHTPAHRERIAREFGAPADSIAVIPHGVPIPPAVPERSSTAERILFVGRLETRKGADLLLAALALTLATRPRLRADLVGPDPGDSWQRRWRAGSPADVGERVTFVGTADDATLARHYAAADVFVAPSRFESFGLIFAEAMAWGLPLVALDAPGAAEIVVHGETGLLSPPEDAAALAANLGRLVDDPGCRLRLGRKGRDRAVARYSRAGLVEASVAFYERLAARRVR